MGPLPPGGFSMKHHMWVAMQYTPIEVSEQNNELVVTVTDLAEEIAREESLLGCWNCHEPLSVESYESECLAE